MGFTGGMPPVRQPATARRNRNYAETHRLLLERAVAMIGEGGVESLSISELARLSNLNRSTVYYHFESRESLIEEVKGWSAAQLARGFAARGGDYADGIAHISRFVLGHAEVLRLWIEDFIAPGDIRARYPEWDAMVAGLRRLLGTLSASEEVDPEVVAVMLLAAAFIAPRVYQLSVRPDASAEVVAQRFAEVQRRLLAVRRWSTAG
ncbi:MAG TPA: helix-turn-helix domain-containing protein [Novosphingobium sp.]|nr:helix-turn-helix domain-containing protein [Novosphingobium sp.]